MVLTSNHAKEKALERPLRSIGLQLSVYRDFDTDILGTFSGEVEREGSQREVAVKKARIGMAVLKCRFGIATEASFGPHPFLPFGALGLETIVFLDDENGCTYFEDYSTTETNYGHTVVSGLSELMSFAKSSDFPSHALIMAPSAASRALDRQDILCDLGMEKGINTEEMLVNCFEAMVAKSPKQTVWVETDMRAHLNPTRMRIIRRAAVKLAHRLATKCPSCQFLGFGLTDKEAGLLCANCKLPTNVVGWFIHSCQRCQFVSKIPKYEPSHMADPQYCFQCNP